MRYARFILEAAPTRHGAAPDITTEVNVKPRTVERKIFGRKKGRDEIGDRLGIAAALMRRSHHPGSQGFGLARSRIAALRHVRSTSVACIRHLAAFLTARCPPAFFRHVHVSRNDRQILRNIVAGSSTSWSTALVPSTTRGACWQPAPPLRTRSLPEKLANVAL